MFTTIINDCHCANARGRQETRVGALLGSPASFIKVESDLEAAGNLVDALDASLGRKGVILVNVAPRNGHAKKWTNGTPFGYFYYQNTLVITTIDGRTLSLAKKLGLVSQIRLVDAETTIKSKLPAEKHHLAQTQFRSFEFTPRLADWLLAGQPVESTNQHLNDVPELEPVVWWVDNFGNAKTSVLDDTPEANKVKAKLAARGFEIISRLKDAPEDKPSVIAGSSGFGQAKFLEIVINGRNVSQEMNIKTGDKIKDIKKH
jgi:hypothetical protein